MIIQSMHTKLNGVARLGHLGVIRVEGADAASFLHNQLTQDFSLLGLSEARLADMVTLVHTGHEEMQQHVNGPVKAVLFNLGYLPGGDHSIITRPETTGVALLHSLKLLATGGIVMVTVYPGHGGGVGEKQTVDDWAAGLEPRQYHSWRMGQMNVISDAPYCILIQKAA